MQVDTLVLAIGYTNNKTKDLDDIKLLTEDDINKDFEIAWSKK